METCDCLWHHVWKSVIYMHHVYILLYGWRRLPTAWHEPATVVSCVSPRPWVNVNVNERNGGYIERPNPIFYRMKRLNDETYSIIQFEYDVRSIANVPVKSVRTFSNNDSLDRNAQMLTQTKIAIKQLIKWGDYLSASSYCIYIHW